MMKSTGTPQRKQVIVPVLFAPLLPPLSTRRSFPDKKNVTTPRKRQDSTNTLKMAKGGLIRLVERRMKTVIFTSEQISNISYSKYVFIHIIPLNPGQK